jgi:Fe-S oxidoreductase
MVRTTDLDRLYPQNPKDIYLFATCLVDQFMPQAGMDTVLLLEREGIRVHYPQAQTCCGQPAHSSGYPTKPVRWHCNNSICLLSPGRWWCRQGRARA